MKNKKVTLIIVMVLSIVTLVSCAKDSKESHNSLSKTEQNQKIKDSVDKVDNIDEATFTNEITQETNMVNTKKVEGRRKEFLDILDNIQKELDTSPEKKESDTGVTIAMRSYYGKAYDMYDKELNNIYDLLKKELSPEIMENLQTEQINWIEQKEATADKEALQYKGGTFEPVAYVSSLYGTTKERCYDLVNNYMTD
ncbi:lysozyme inhibitor LprI family protein [uncultured Clostridium sp.]|jgi:putative lipoprotein|uniref:lysozyme inhibitor LprI family protein n=1 Tax=uncultured Clostridium sp. TaxID=59620 RepID=UPI0025CC86BF|nr:lysozyme inhibitor LprI family protein [uncultured Clostridium sp.]